MEDTPMVLAHTKNLPVQMFGSYHQVKSRVDFLKERKKQMKNDITCIEEILKEKDEREHDEFTIKDLAKKYLAYITLCDEIICGIDQMCALLTR